MKPTLVLMATAAKPLGDRRVHFETELAALTWVGSKVRRIAPDFVEILGPFDHDPGVMFRASVWDGVLYIHEAPAKGRKKAGYSRIHVKLPKEEP